MTLRESTDRIVIIGAGHVGATAAYAMMLRGIFPEIVLIDDNHALASAEAADLSDANALARPSRIWAGTYDDAASAKVAVITAGAATHGAENRLSVAARSAQIVRDCVNALDAAGFDGILLIAANPVDVMTAIAFNSGSLPASQVLGTGTLLDSNRLRQMLAAHFNVAASAVDAVVLGEHGDSEVAIFSAVRIGGIPLQEFQTDRPILDTVAVAKAVRESAYSIVSGKGYTSFGIATAIVRICEAIIRNERAVLPISTLMHGIAGADEIAISMPCIIGANGVEQVLAPLLNADEAAAFRSSSLTIQGVVEAQVREAGLPQSNEVAWLRDEARSRTTSE
ncbi:L-lactate dehydrogenase [Sphingobium sp. AR-3-1]|uniref:L-lactate dehydrogenase n=3 Tax=Sphingobium TaxID=165695 RepID=A0A7X9ZSV6_9SPHN|nr:L-lactate dehydrogenase [Sphingobium psychrophilum]